MAGMAVVVFNFFLVLTYFSKIKKRESLLLKGLLFCIILFCSICYIINVDAGIVFLGGEENDIYFHLIK